VTMTVLPPVLPPRERSTGGFGSTRYSFDQIVSIMRQRRTADEVLIRAMVENRDRYNLDVVVPTPDLSSIPAANRPGPNFFMDAIDGHAQAANSVMPKINCPIVNPESDHSKALAERRQGALYGSWHENWMQLKMMRWYRHLAAYGTCAMVVLPDEEKGTCRVELRDPLTAYPELRSADDIRLPKDCGFLFARSAEWIRSHYPLGINAEFLAMSQSKGWDTLWDIVEWIDENDIVIGVMGPRFPPYGYADQRPYGYNALELGRWPNKSGCVPVVIPRRATLDRVIGQMTSLIGYTDLYARMLDLYLVGTEKAIFPDLAVLGRTSNPPRLVGGKWKDGRTGEVNIVVDGTFEVVGKEVGPGTAQGLALMDGHIQRSGGATAVMGGDAGGMRTGAGVSQLANLSLSPKVAESQHIMARSLEALNEAWFLSMKGNFGPKKFTVALGLSGSDKTVTYTPEKDFDHPSNVVTYPFPGADINQAAVAATQLAATELISKRTARNKHPMIDDPDYEEATVAIEKLDDATMAAIAQEVTQGQLPTEIVALTRQLVAKGKTLDAAFLEAKAQMATQGAAPGTEQGPPPVGGDGQPIPPGLAQALASQGSSPSQQPGDQIPAPNQSLMDFRHVLQGVNENVSPSAV